MSKTDQMLHLIKYAHSGQYRNAGKVPYWQHCANVAEILKSTLTITGEEPADGLFTDMMLAALGHDLLEDTNVTEDELRKQFGDRPTNLIVSLTNYQGDSDTEIYLNKISGILDEAKLIKYCDLLDNTLSVAYGLHDLGDKWANSFFIPIVQSTYETLSLADIYKYPKSTIYLRSTFSTALDVLYLNLENSHKQA